MSMTCDATIDLRTPVGSERVRGFQPPWRTVYRYRCSACGHEVRVRANSFRGTRPEPSVGGIRCGAALKTAEV
jgi:DNA-directed RNA polymerase subunit RPC12/RpoP